LLFALLLIVAGAVLSQRQGGTDDAPREGSRVIEGSQVRVAKRTLTSYAIRYTVETYTDSGVTRSTDDVLVRRPFDSRVRSAGVGETTDTFSTLGRYSVRGQAFYVPPGAPDADRRPDTVLADALKDGYAEAREAREVVGRRCRVYRFGDGSDVTSLSLLEEADTYTDVCVDEAGLILEEATFDGRDLVRRRIAKEVDESPTISKDLFDLEVADGDARQLGSVQPLEDDSRLPGDEFWQLTDPPKGFRFEGRYAVVPPGQPGFSDIASRGSVVTFLSEVWTDGEDVIVIDQGATQGTKAFDTDPNAKQVNAGALGKGEVLFSMRESEARFLTGGVRFLRVRGTVPPSRLLDVARSLEAVDGGPLRLKDAR
jgi:hypothetical protein